MDTARLLGKTFDISLGNTLFSPSYVQAIAIIFLLFLLVLATAQMRRHFIGWSAKGAIFGLFIGFVLALILEGFLIIGGRTAFTEILGWKNAPKPILTALEAGRAKLVTVLGVTDEIPSSSARGEADADGVVRLFQSLSVEDAADVRGMICTP
jgi:hypothetical protein